MGILDEAIREHLELKRQHGADDSELKQLEDEAFGPAERPGAPEGAPDSFGEAPTQFMAQPEVPEGEAPPAGEEAKHRRERAAGILDLQEAPDQRQGSQLDEPFEEEQPAGEHEALTDAGGEAQSEAEPLPLEESEEIEAEESAEAPEVGPATEERHAIAEQPTEHYDVEEALAASEPSQEEEAPTSGPSQEEEPVAEPSLDDEQDFEEEDDDFFNEQRLSDELDRALEAPRAPEPEEEPDREQGSEAEEGPGREPAPGPEQEPSPEQGSEVEEEQSASADAEDVLEGTPDFLEETPEDDELWFEQKPPKDFDFDD